MRHTVSLNKAADVSKFIVINVRHTATGSKEDLLTNQKYKVHVNFRAEIVCTLQLWQGQLKL